MIAKLQIAADLALPLDAVTQTFVIVGVRGSGKSTTAVLMAEAMLDAQQQIVVLDPTDTWWGLRADLHGKDAGIPITVLGGRHEDAPLDPSAGEVIADLVVDEHVSCVLSLKQFSDGDKARFVTAFAARLYKRNRDPVHIFFDEAQLFAPQVPMRGEEQMLGLVKRLVMQGRTGGIGASFITQRPAVLNKNVMTQCETLIAMRVVGKHDRDAVEAWVDAWAETAAQQKEFEAALPSLETGTGFVWSPAWLKLFRRVDFPLPRTFDSRRTPKAGQSREPKVLAKVDLEKLRAQMAATIERAKADDPRELRAEIARLKKQIGDASRAAPDPAAIQKAVAAALDSERAKCESKLRSTANLAQDLHRDAANLFGELGAAADALANQRHLEKQNGHPERRLPESKDLARSSAHPADTFKLGRGAAASNPKVAGSNPASPPNSLGKGERRVLTAIAQYGEGVERDELTVLTGYKRSSRDTYLARLFAAGYAAGRGSGLILATEAGIAALGADFEPLPTGQELQHYYLERLPPGEKTILAVLIHEYPAWMPRERLDESTGYKRSSRDTYLNRLSARHLIETRRGEVCASERLF